MVIKKKSQITFVYSPDNGGQKVQLVGTFNNWQADSAGTMSKQKDGTFRKRLTLEPGEYRYKFLVDGQWVEDPAADGLVPNQFGTYDSLIKVG